MADLVLILAAACVAAGGALAYHLWATRAPRARRGALAVGQTPLRLRSRLQAVRREVAHG